MHFLVSASFYCYLLISFFKELNDFNIALVMVNINSCKNGARLRVYGLLPFYQILHGPVFSAFLQVKELILYGKCYGFSTVFSYLYVSWDRRVDPDF